MLSEAQQFLLVLERIIQRALEQFSDLSDEDLNRPLALPESNSAFVLATHLIGSAEYWVLELAGGRDIQRDRLSEFRAVGSGRQLIARYQRWIVAARELLQEVPRERMEQVVNIVPAFHPTFEANKDPLTLREALLHAVEHCALHQGHLELTRQLLGYAPAGAQ